MIELTSDQLETIKAAVGKNYPTFNRFEVIRKSEALCPCGEPFIWVKIFLSDQTVTSKEENMLFVCLKCGTTTN